MIKNVSNAIAFILLLQDLSERGTSALIQTSYHPFYYFTGHLVVVRST